MNTRVAALVTLLAAASAGCAESPTEPFVYDPPSTTSGSASGSGGGGTGGGSTSSGEGGASSGAQAVFENDVYPGLAQECAACHGPNGSAPVWLGADAASSYALMVDYTFTDGSFLNPAACSALLTKTSGNHAGPDFSDELGASTASWLDLEAEQRALTCGGGQNAGALEDCNAAMAELQACMTQTVWDDAGMGLVASQQTAGDGPCLGCHGTGTGSYYANANSQLSFDVNKADAYFLQKYITCSFEGGGFSDLVASERVKNKGTEACAGEPCHPTFVLTTERATAIDTFVGDTIAAWKAGSCN